ncbi:MAG: nucleotidyltransferase domain-containing protein [Methanosarcinales archaeon]|nr:nucleotidyltransferase domain-containing protein [Methanosarcinales archaeon]
MKDKRFKPGNREKNRIRGILKEVIATIRVVEFAYIYGSFPEDWGFHDIDVAVYLTRTEHVDPLECELSIASMLERRIRLPVDVRVLNHAPNSFCYEVTRGEVIFSRNEEVRFCFVERTWNKYLDFKPVMEIILHELAA